MRWLVKNERKGGSLRGGCKSIGVKQGYACNEREEIAKKAVMMKATMRNMAVLSATGFTGFRFLLFPSFAFEVVWSVNFFRNDEKFLNDSVKLTAPKEIRLPKGDGGKDGFAER
jgi:hypothetical protein